MAYVELADLGANIPPQFIVDALDDNGDGVQDTDAWEKVQVAVGKEVDDILGARYKTPFSYPYPPAVSTAARIFACELLYQRRGIEGAKNPWASRAKEERNRLKAIAAGDIPLGPGFKRAVESAAVVTEAAKTTNSTGALST